MPKQLSLYPKERMPEIHDCPCLTDIDGLNVQRIVFTRSRFLFFLSPKPTLLVSISIALQHYLITYYDGAAVILASLASPTLGPRIMFEISWIGRLF